MSKFYSKWFKFIQGCKINSCGHEM